MKSIGRKIIGLISLIGLLGPLALASDDPKEIKTEEDSDAFMQTYYLKPKPALIPSMIDYLGEHRVFDLPHASPPVISFLAEVFSANPKLIADWKKVIEKQDPTTRKALQLALENTPEQLAKKTAEGPERNDIHWGAFFASGNTAYVNKITDQLNHLGERKDAKLYLTAASAKWSLCSNAKTHPKVKAVLEDLKTKGPPELRPIASEILRMDPNAVQQETIQVIREQRKMGLWLK